jgi:ATP-dependent Clp protease ATP-binding subunit ClpA
MENFTSEAKKVLSLATEDARSRRHNYVGTEHILIGLLKLGAGAVFGVLTQNQSLVAWYSCINREMRDGRDLVDQIVYTPRTRKVLNLAHKEAEAVGSVLIGPEHILLALVREGDGLAAKVMRDMGVATLEELRVVLFTPPPASKKPSALFEMYQENANEMWWLDRIELLRTDLSEVVVGSNLMNLLPRLIAEAVCEVLYKLRLGEVSESVNALVLKDAVCKAGKTLHLVGIPMS